MIENRALAEFVWTRKCKAGTNFDVQNTSIVAYVVEAGSLSSQIGLKPRRTGPLLVTLYINLTNLMFANSEGGISMVNKSPEKERKPGKKKNLK